MSLKSRWGRVRQELGALFRLATPIIIAQFTHTAMGFTDALMAGRVSPRDLAAVALGNSIWVPLYLFMTGVILATTPKVAQRFGAGQPQEIGPLVRQALWLALFLGCSAATLLWHADVVLRSMRVETSLMEPSMGYLRAMAFGFPAVAMYQALRCFSDGIGYSRPSMFLGIFGLLINIPATYVFVFGKLGLPAMGGVGCGWGTALVMNCMLLGLLGWIKLAPRYRPSQLFAHFEPPSWQPIRGLLTIGLPIGIAIFAESSIFAVIALLIGGLGATVMAGHQIALNFSSMIFMLPLSLGIAVTVRVGQALGRGEPREARFCAGVGMFSALCYACCSATVVMLLSEHIARIYTEDLAVIAVAGSLLFYVALFQFSDAIQVTAAGALRGYQDTRATMIFTLLAYWGVGLPVGYALGLTDWLGEPSGPRGLWQGLVVGLSCAAVLLATRLARSSRKRIHKAARRARA